MVFPARGVSDHSGRALACLIRLERRDERLFVRKGQEEGHQEVYNPQRPLDGCHDRGWNDRNGCASAAWGFPSRCGLSFEGIHQNPPSPSGDNVYPYALFMDTLCEIDDVSS